MRRMVMVLLGLVLIWPSAAGAINMHDDAARRALDDLAEAQHDYFAGTGSYSASIEELEGYGYLPAEDVRVVIEYAAADGWRATARHPQGTQAWVWDSRLGGLQ
jgi:hypothetical protein